MRNSSRHVNCEERYEFAVIFLACEFGHSTPCLLTKLRNSKRIGVKWLSGLRPTAIGHSIHEMGYLGKEIVCKKDAAAPTEEC